MRTRATTTVVIAAGAVLAAVIVTKTPAQQESGPAGACCLPTGGCWPDVSENSCTLQGGTFLGGGTVCVGSSCPAPPTVVGIAALPKPGTSAAAVYRVWSDGQLDYLNNPYSCDQANPCVIVPGSCPTDINRDGDTGIIDFLTLLGGWGACR